MTISSFENTSDEQLMHAAQNGNKAAFEELYKRYSSRLYGYFYRMLRQDSAVAEDYTQEVFLKIVQNKSRFDTTKKFKTWVFSIANNMCKNNYRKDEIKQRAAMELKSKPKSTPADEGKTVDQQSFKKALEKALGNLNEAKRACFILRFKHELSIKEIAQMEKVSEGTIKSRIFYTLKELTSALKEFNPKLIHDTLG